jgi:COP9 signalosome complex subunit 5
MASAAGSAAAAIAVETARDLVQGKTTARTESLDDAEIYHFDKTAYFKSIEHRPWKDDVKHFKKVKISAISMLKMVLHAIGGGEIEVMGLMTGKVVDDTMIVLDSFALPVEGTETRVNAQAEGYEYMVQFMETLGQVGRGENAVGWYHSHPGYGTWLSGIDTATQRLNQTYQEPWLAVVVDPVETVASGRVSIGAFRVFPEGHKGEDSGDGYQSIPASKIEDFGVHAGQYYQLEVSYFKSEFDGALLDLLWNKYWVGTLSSNSLRANEAFVSGKLSDVANKLERADQDMAHSRFGGIGGGGHGLPLGDGDSRSGGKKKEASALEQATVDSSKIALEQLSGVMAQITKDALFNKTL